MRVTTAVWAGHLVAQQRLEEIVEHEAIRALVVYNRYVEIPLGTAAAGVEPAGER